MKKSILILLAVLLSVFQASAQERQYTDKELGGVDNGVVGKISDELTVTGIGQLSYEIPIPVPAGTAGLKPAVSVSYSSSTKEGLFGYGFDLSGLSIISRTPSDKFHDGKPTAINFTRDDHFALDGQRLAKYEQGKNEYRTINNIFAKIVYQGKETCPSSFTVYTKSGLTYEYTPLSKALGGEDNDSTLFWLVTKVSDTNGNYYKVSYEGDAATNDFRPSQIDYTGNDKMGLVPYATIHFSYHTKKYAPTTYVNGARVRKSKIISTINIKVNGTWRDAYFFTYREINRKDHLKEVSELKNGSKLNPTTLSWADFEDFKVENHNYTQSSSIHKATLSVADFNGDGKADFLVTPENKNAGWKGWKLYLSHGTYFEQVSNGTWNWPDDETEQVACGDFNGDGYDDVVVKRVHAGKYHNCDLYLSTVGSDGKVSLKFSKCFLSLSTDYGIKTVDLNGDGAVDFFAWIYNSKECKLIYSVVASDGILPLNYTAQRYSSMNWDRVEFGDFNGDGLTDVMNMDQGTKCYVMFSDGSGTMTRETNMVWPNKFHHIKFGDFNGDGKSDMLLTGTDSGDWDEWCILYSKGDGHYESVYQRKLFDGSTKDIFVADINGDGFDDILAIDTKSTENETVRPLAYLNDGQGGFHKESPGGSLYATDKWNFYTGDFNGDGKVDLLCTANWTKSTWDGYQLYLMPTNHANLLNGVTDGFGNTTTISYKYLSDQSIFTRGRTNSYPIMSVGLSWPVVSSVTSPDGIGGVNTVTYHYQDALFHKSGLGFLGFSHVTKEDEITNSTTVTDYEACPTKYVMAPKRERTSIGGNMANEKEYGYTLNTSFSGIYTYLPTSSHQKSYEYNTGEVVSDMTSSTLYDSFGNVTKNTTVSGGITTTTANVYADDESKWHLGRLVNTTVCKSSSTGEITKTSDFSYDEETGLLTSEAFLPSNTSVGYRKKYIHDGYGNIVQSTIVPNGSSASRTSFTEYDNEGRFVVKTINNLGFTTTYTLDDFLGVTTTSVDANGIKTSNQYDKFGNLQETQTPISKSLHTLGWSKGMEDAPALSLYFEWGKSTGGPYTIAFYDQLGRTVRTVTESIGGKKVYTDISYNKKGQVEKTSEPYFPGETVYWNTNEYDPAGRIIRQTNPAGDSYTFEYKGLTSTTMDPIGSVVTKTNDLNGMLVKSMDNDGMTVTYKYDNDGKCIETKGPRTTIRAEYDLAGNRITLDDPDLGISQDSYNAYGELVKHTDGHGTTTYGYDGGGRILQEKRPDMTILSQYDKQWKGALDAISTEQSVAASTEYNYDRYGRIVKETDEIENLKYVTYTSYDEEGHVSTITYPRGLQIKNNYDAFCGALVSVSNNQSGKELWRLQSLNARGQVEKEQFGNGLVTTTSYNAKRGTIAGIVTPGIQNWSYEFNAVGNLSARKNISRNLTETFRYDGLHRLIEVLQNGKTRLSMSYDEAGNLTKKSDIGTYAYKDGSNRLSSITDCIHTPMSWDAITYNSLGKITSVKSGDDSMTIDYGPEKSRVKTTINGICTYYPNSFFEEKIDGSKKTSTCYIFGLGKAIAVASDTPDGTGVYSFMYLHHDQLGSIQAYSDEAGKLRQELSYDAWGARRNPSNWERYDKIMEANAWKERGFGGHEHIDLFEMINMDGRMYDPMIGRFLSADPFVQSPDFTQSLNRYAYCLNNPLSLIDPSGYSWFSKNWKSLLASAVGIAVSVVTAGTGTGPTIALLAGAAGGAAGALTGALLNGANIGQIAKTTLTGAFWGGVSAYLNNISGDDDIIASLFKHTITQGGVETLQNGNMLHGFMMGLVSAGGGSLIDHNLGSLGKIGEVTANSILSGTIDELGGGKFANGAICGAFTFLFNDWAHHHFSDKILKKIYDTYTQGSMRDNIWMNPKKLCKQIGGKLGEIASEVQNGCAIRLSYALNKCGLFIPHVQGTFKGADGHWYFVKASEMRNYLKRYYVGTISNSSKAMNGMVYEYPKEEWVRHGVSGHVDVVYRSMWGSQYQYFDKSCPYPNLKTDVFH